MKAFGFAVLIALPCLFPVTSAAAQSRADAMAAVLRCTAITNDTARLACYDKAAGQTRSALARPEAAPPPPPPQQDNAGDDGSDHWFENTFGTVPDRAPQTSVAQFGSETLTSKFAQPGHIRGDTVNTIEAGMTRYVFRGGLITVTLDNGQVWRQIPGDPPIGYLARPASSYRATIKRGWGGSYVMTLSGLQRRIHVLRIE
jgi:hypothetical protein